jgi:hypothetical protein
MKKTALALMEMESLDGINLFFPGLGERPTEAPPSLLEKKVYDGELVMDSRIKLLTTYFIKNDIINY